MIILDTNIVSEFMRPQPNEGVVQWLGAQVAETTYITAITLAELRLGLATMPKGQRQDMLADRISKLETQSFNGRCLPFDAKAAHSYALITAHRRAIGRPISQSDAMIAAITRSLGMTLATRNAGDFVETNIKLHNPWQE
jgi:toxin FitB